MVGYKGLALCFAVLCTTLPSATANNHNKEVLEGRFPPIRVSATTEKAGIKKEQFEKVYEWATNRDRSATKTVDSDFLAKIKDIHKGQRAFLMGNGPSLNKVETKWLEDEITFGVNNIIHNFDNMGFMVNYFLLEDKLLVEDRAAEFNTLPSGFVKFYGDYLQEWLVPRMDVVFMPVDFDYRTRKNWPSFGEDISQKLYVGGSVTYLAMQLAFHMGIEELIMIGFDHNYHIPKTVKQKGNDLTSTEDDPNHFFKGYFGKNLRWHLPRTDRMEIGFAKAGLHFEKAGRRIYNATPGGKLEVFPRKPYESFFPDRVRSS